jgi:hypothetical protein
VLLQVRAETLLAAPELVRPLGALEACAVETAKVPSPEMLVHWV